jgi:5-carboxymethyl-2-hydroxymuconate isomerase
VIKGRKQNVEEMRRGDEQRAWNNYKLEVGRRRRKKKKDNLCHKLFTLLK